MKRFYNILWLAAAMLTVPVSCSDDYHSSIPDVRVNFSCSLLQNPYYKIQTQGTFIIVPKDNHNLPLGYAGLIIGQTLYGEYLSFDAACPVEISRTVSVEVQEDGIGTAICPSCHTKYNLSEGGYPEGKGTEYLKRYKTMVTGNELRVTN